MTQPRSSRLPLVAAVCIGIAVGALMIAALQSQPRTAPVELHPSSPEGGQMRSMVSSMEALTEALTRLEEYLDEVLARAAVPTPIASAAPQEAGRQAIDSTPAGNSGNKEGSSHWVTVLHGDLARVLVERGLTPYDPGVAEHVTSAGNALRNALDDYETAQSPLNKEYEGGLPLKDYNEASKNNSEKYKKRRKEIVEQLAVVLDALSKGPDTREDP